LTILDCGIVEIGDRVLVGPKVSICAATHSTDVAERRAGRELGSRIAIGDDCWIGAGVTIVGPAVIGRGCTIGAGAVVLGDIG
jgi:acetyltransferase-like isoleucine patch superfamily enzyme